MHKKALGIALVVILVLLVSSGVAYAATPRGQLTWAIGSLPLSAQSALRAAAQPWADALPMDTTFESWTTVKLTSLDAPKLNAFGQKVALAAQAQLDVCYDKAQSSGAAQLSLSSGGIPALGLSLYLSDDALALQSSELLDRPVLIPVGKTASGTTLGRRLQGIAGAAVPGGAQLAWAAAWAMRAVPAQNITTESRKVTLLGWERDCTAVIMHLQGDALAQVLRSVAAEGSFARTLWSLGDAELADALEAAAKGDDGVLRARLQQAQLALTVQRCGVDVVGWRLDWQQPGRAWSVELTAYHEGKQADLRLAMRGLGRDIDVSVLQTDEGDARHLAVRAAIGGAEWKLNADSSGGTLDVASDGTQIASIAFTEGSTAEADAGGTAFRAELPRWGARLEGNIARTTTTATPDVPVPTWDGGDVDVMHMPAELLAKLGKMGERLRTLAASVGIRAR